ncbi:AAA-type ATPase lid domain-containing protein [Rossellomorea sp. H39__3]
MEEKRFRSDLYYRINVIPFQLPSLRERKGDLSTLASFFLEKSTKSSGKRISGFTDDVLEIFTSHSWPGNLRELENVIHAATYLTSGTKIKINALPSYLKVGNLYKTGSKSLKEMMEETERAILEETIRTYPDKRKAAQVLGVGKSSLYEKLNKYQIQ